MTQNTTIGASFLNLFLRIMVYALIGILITIPLCIIGDQLGIFDALGIQF
ncbi:hypothetical protein L0P88_05085 [Muricauda sp. SCSIO 64092]|nr:hypothetical protein [Muricauda sp. SCSIO 64092]UOY07924.1 hypothetical protein L0P88_05085 [Muricauda sp. SCSIO 64092]